MLLTLSFLLASEKQTLSFSFSWGSSGSPSYWLSPLNTLMLQFPLFWIILYLTLLYLLIITVFLSFPQQVVSFAETSWPSLPTPDPAAVASSRAPVISNHQTQRPFLVVLHLDLSAAFGPANHPTLGELLVHVRHTKI